MFINVCQFLQTYVAMIIIKSWLFVPSRIVVYTIILVIARLCLVYTCIMSVCSHYSISPTHAKSVYLEQWQIEERESKRRKGLEHYVSENYRPHCIMFGSSQCSLYVTKSKHLGVVKY